MTAGGDDIDRLAPTRRPAGPVVMHQRWRDLLFLHWPVLPETIQSRLPPGLTADTFDGRAYLGLVPFTMRGVRPSFLPAVPGLSDFPEVNVRTYVHRGGRDSGVWFFSLDAANAIAVAIARTLFKLPYFHARMTVTTADGQIRYQSDRRRPEPTPAACDLLWRPSGDVRPATPGTLAYFLAERYVLYSAARGRLYRGRVHHTPYPLQSADVLRLDETLIAAAGFKPPTTPPIVHFAAGVDVHIYPLHRVR